MQELYNDMSFIIGFMVLCLIVSMSSGNKALKYFLLATMFSVIILNADAFINFIQGTLTLNDTSKGV
uniref:Uncharacterized protein n=1 Tax=Tectiviridae sp. TaxID=2831614 RepID=A0A8S5VXY4_9VIRU|nr:MAG TPA: hypothetical protein [Tectiviridae sp.]